MAFLKVNTHTLLLYAVMCVQFSTISAQGGSSVSSSHSCKMMEVHRLHHKETPSSAPLPDSVTMPSCPALPSQDNTLAEESTLILQIRDLMEQDHLYLQSELKISDVANALGTNSRYVSESIRNYEGCTFTQFINRYRVEHAEQILLKAPDKKVSAVSEESGFSNETTFFRTFKAIKGMTPREWLSSQKLDEAKE